jgi:hypothetical protein
VTIYAVFEGDTQPVFLSAWTTREAAEAEVKRKGYGMIEPVALDNPDWYLDHDEEVK